MIAGTKGSFAVGWITSIPATDLVFVQYQLPPNDSSEILLEPQN
jgi:hypothetical protein